MGCCEEEQTLHCRTELFAHVRLYSYTESGQCGDLSHYFTLSLLAASRRTGSSNLWWNVLCVQSLYVEYNLNDLVFYPNTLLRHLHFALYPPSDQGWNVTLQVQSLCFFPFFVCPSCVPHSKIALSSCSAAGGTYPFGLTHLVLELVWRRLFRPLVKLGCSGFAQI